MKKFLFITDLDYTLVGDDQAMIKLNQRLQLHRQQHNTKIVYSTGRSPVLYQQLKAEKKLLEPDILICSVGTEIYSHNKDTPDVEWSEKLSPAWDQELVINISADYSVLKLQPPSEQRPFKVSYFIEENVSGDILPELESKLIEKGLDIQVIRSGGDDLDNIDILPRNANKGMAMTFVREKLEMDVAQTVACGDSGNDIALFADKKEKGIIVGNAKQELLKWHNTNPNPNRYLAAAKYAAGIEEGLQHFNFFS